MGGVETDITEELALRLKLQLQRNVTQRFMDAVADVNSPQQIVTRDLEPGIDLESGADNGWNGTDEVWTQDFTGGTANAWNEAYTIDSDSGAEDKVLGIVALQFQAADPPTHGVRILRGTDGSQGFSEEAHVQQAFNDDEGEAYFNSAVIFGLNENGQIEHYIDETATDTVLYLGAVAENVGENIATPQNPMLSGNLSSVVEQMGTRPVQNTGSQ